jgi:hypothetical protein
MNFILQKTTLCQEFVKCTVFILQILGKDKVSLGSMNFTLAYRG